MFIYLFIYIYVYICHKYTSTRYIYFCCVPCELPSKAGETEPSKDVAEPWRNERMERKVGDIQSLYLYTYVHIHTHLYVSLSLYIYAHDVFIDIFSVKKHIHLITFEGFSNYYV